MKKLWKVIVPLTVVCMIIIMFLYSGIYNIGATSPHNKLTLWMINTLKDNSIEHHSKGIVVPNLNDSSMVKLGFTHYREMCVGCHAGPGLSRDEVGQGLYPRAPILARSAKELSPAQLFWITKNGIKMTGMPAFGKTHSDEKIWAIVSFLEKLPGMSNEQYNQFNKSIKEEDDD